ncbi:SHD1 domain-containing protein [Bremerella sp. JC817]
MGLDSDSSFLGHISMVWTRPGAVLLLVMLSTTMVSGREWTDSTGKFKIDAEYESFRDGALTLRKANGDMVTVPWERLSSADQQFLKSRPEVKAYLGEQSPAAVGPPSVVKISTPTGVTEGEVRRFKAPLWGFRNITFSPSGAWIAAGMSSGKFQLLDVEHEAVLNEISKLDDLGDILACCFSPDGTRLATAGYRKQIAIWKVSPRGDLSRAGTLTGHKGPISSMAFSPDSTKLLTGSSDQKLIYWDLATHQMIHEFKEVHADVKECVFTPNGKQALATEGRKLHLFDLENKRFLETMEFNKSYPQRVTISPTGEYVAVSSSYDIRIVNTVTGVGRLMHDTEIQWSLKFLPDGKRLVTGAKAKLSVWDITTGEYLKTIELTNIRNVQELACSPDGDHVAVTGVGPKQDVIVVRISE